MTLNWDENLSQIAPYQTELEANFANNLQRNKCFAWGFRQKVVETFREKNLRQSQMHYSVLRRGFFLFIMGRKEEKENRPRRNWGAGERETVRRRLQRREYSGVKLWRVATNV